MKKRGRILVVDDDYGSLEVIATALHADHDIITATNGHDAITMIKEHVPDLIILDVMLPDVSGFDVCRIIKSYDAYADIPVLFLTGLDTLEGEIRGFSTEMVKHFFVSLSESMKANIHLSILRERIRTTKLRRCSSLLLMR